LNEYSSNDQDGISVHTNIVPCKNNYDANSRLCIFGTEYIMCRLLRSAVSIKNSPWRIILFYLRPPK